MSFSSSNSALVTELLLKCYGANTSREENTSKRKAVGNGHTNSGHLGHKIESAKCITWQCNHIGKFKL